MSFHYYDPIQHIITNKISSEKKQYFSQRNKLLVEKHDEIQSKLFNFFGFYSDGLSTKYVPKAANNSHKATAMKQIDHYRSVHTTGIQKSQYLMIEDDPRVIKSYLKHNHDKNHVHNEKEADEYNHICKEPELCLKYCHE